MARSKYSKVRKLVVDYNRYYNKKGVYSGIETPKTIRQLKHEGFTSKQIEGLADLILEEYHTLRREGNFKFNLETGEIYDKKHKSNNAEYPTLNEVKLSNMRDILYSLEESIRGMNDISHKGLRHSAYVNIIDLGYDLDSLLTAEIDEYGEDFVALSLTTAQPYIAELEQALKNYDSEGQPIIRAGASLFRVLSNLPAEVNETYGDALEEAEGFYEGEEI